MTAEQQDRRYLGGISFVDAVTGALIKQQLSVTADNAQLFQNRSGRWIVEAATGLDHHLGEFTTPPVLPIAGSVALTGMVRDPSGYYLPRRFSFALPRAPSDGADSLFDSLDVELFVSPRGQALNNWASVRTRILSAGLPLSGAMVTVERTADDTLLARGMSDVSAHPFLANNENPTVGELFVPVPGLPVTAWGEAPDEPVLVNEVGVRIDVRFDPNAGAVPDPDGVLSGPVRGSRTLNLAAGRPEHIAELSINLP